MGGHMESIIAVLTLVSASTAFDTLVAEAKPVPNLGRLLAGYVGECDAGEVADGRQACRRSVRRFRRDWRGQLARVTIEEPADVVRFVGFDRRKKAFRLNLVPFFAARGFGMSVGRPRRINGQGQPVMRNLPLWVKLPEDRPPFVFRRDLERGMVRLELVVVPKKTYRVRRAGKTPVRGLEVALKGLRLVGARSGEVLVEQTYTTSARR